MTTVDLYMYFGGSFVLVYSGLGLGSMAFLTFLLSLWAYLFVVISLEAILLLYLRVMHCPRMVYVL